MKPLASLSLILLCGTAARGAEKIDFQRDIRPLLSDNCFKCHGPDDAARKGKFRLDRRDAAVKGGRSGDPGIVPGKPGKSSVIDRILSDNPARLMPPPKSGKTLSPQQHDLLRRWIAEGAVYQQPLAYVAPRRPPLPKVRDLSRVQNPIDLFILARLEAAGLTFSPAAARETLVRRMTLDLLGLPPPPEWVDAFLADLRPDAFARFVSFLLSAPHYGERWARHWLDAARYADSDGFEKDKPRFVWMYRDWVTAALNSDMPYDQFIIRQIAGDLLPGATQDDHVATGFLRNSMINEEGGIDPEQFRMEAMFDRMDALGKAVLGLTLGCAQCHSHKYDPISHEEYYRLFAFLNDTNEASMVAYPPAEQSRRFEVLRTIRELEQGLKRSPDWEKRMAAWEAKERANVLPWTVVRVKNAGDNGQRYDYHDDGSLTAGGYAPTKWTAPFTGRTDAKKITGIRLELMNDPNLPLGGPGRSPTGLFALTEFQVDVADARTPLKKQRIKFISATADFGNERKPLEKRYDDKTKKARVTGPVSYALDGDDLTAWGIDAGPGRRNVERNAVFVPENPIELPEGAVLTFHLRQMHGGWNSDDNQTNNLGRFRFSVTDAEAPEADQVPGRVRAILGVPVKERTVAQMRSVFSYWRTTVADWEATNEKIEAAWRKHPEGAPQLTTTARTKTRPTFVLDRGDFLRPTKQVKPGTPAALHPGPEGGDRLALARWLVDRESPTTARAIVNRVWQSYFGAGLVVSSEDLGVQSDAPSHPELLDWLAVEFMDNGWSLKHLHRLIVGSATYQQSSRLTPHLARVDPENRLLSRGPRLRVEAEVVRDIALAVSGRLTPRLGGPPVYPPAPAFLFVPPASYGPKVWLEDPGDNRYRRALYTFRFRSAPYPVLNVFDAPNGDASCVRRSRSNTPLQALATLNEPLFLEAARGLARRAMMVAGTDGERLTYAFRLCTARRPTARELRVLEAFLSRQIERFEAPGASPRDLAADNPEAPMNLPAGETEARAAAWTALARLLLNLDETITKE